eukprot:GHVT01069875.1.p1 GENE.GHVT01069875.1~~GHVT01069875.1.p1  ORF type:complete len:1103 (+),score=193.20 GHVT01069875.1:7345-10653(+)
MALVAVRRRIRGACGSSAHLKSHEGQPSGNRRRPRSWHPGLLLRGHGARRPSQSRAFTALDADPLLLDSCAIEEGRPSDRNPEGCAGGANLRTSALLLQPAQANQCKHPGALAGVQEKTYEPLDALAMDQFFSGKPHPENLHEVPYEHRWLFDDSTSCAQPAPDEKNGNKPNSQWHLAQGGHSDNPNFFPTQRNHESNANGYTGLPTYYSTPSSHPSSSYSSASSSVISSAFFPPSDPPSSLLDFASTAAAGWTAVVSPPPSPLDARALAASSTPPAVSPMNAKQLVAFYRPTCPLVHDIDQRGADGSPTTSHSPENGGAPSKKAAHAALANRLGGSVQPVDKTPGSKYPAVPFAGVRTPAGNFEATPHNHTEQGTADFQRDSKSNLVAVESSPRQLSPAKRTLLSPSGDHPPETVEGRATDVTAAVRTPHAARKNKKAAEAAQLPASVAAPAVSQAANRCSVTTPSSSRGAERETANCRFERRHLLEQTSRLSPYYDGSVLSNGDNPIRRARSFLLGLSPGCLPSAVPASSSWSNSSRGCRSPRSAFDFPKRGASSLPAAFSSKRDLPCPPSDQALTERGWSHPGCATTADMLSSRVLSSPVKVSVASRSGRRRPASLPPSRGCARHLDVSTSHRRTTGCAASGPNCSSSSTVVSCGFSAQGRSGADPCVAIDNPLPFALPINSSASCAVIGPAPRLDGVSSVATTLGAFCSSIASSISAGSVVGTNDYKQSPATGAPSCCLPITGLSHPKQFATEAVIASLGAEAADAARVQAPVGPCTSCEPATLALTSPTCLRVLRGAAALPQLQLPHTPSFTKRHPRAAGQSADPVEVEGTRLVTGGVPEGGAGPSPVASGSTGPSHRTAFANARGGAALSAHMRARSHAAAPWAHLLGATGDLTPSTPTPSTPTPSTPTRYTQPAQPGKAMPTVDAALAQPLSPSPSPTVCGSAGLLPALERSQEDVEVNINVDVDGDVANVADVDVVDVDEGSTACWAAIGGSVSIAALELSRCSVSPRADHFASCFSVCGMRSCRLLVTARAKRLRDKRMRPRKVPHRTKRGHRTRNPQIYCRAVDGSLFQRLMRLADDRHTLANAALEGRSPP